MNSRRKKFFISFFKYSISLAIAAFLFWLVYGDVNFKIMFRRFAEVDNFLLGLSVVVGLLTYYVRAYRWNILLEPLGYRLTSSRTFLAVMTGYFANLLVPRMGELTRCASLKKTDNVDFPSSFGSVIAERALDMLVLLLITFTGFVIEFDKIIKVLQEPLESGVAKIDNFLGIIMALAGITLLILAAIYFLYTKYKTRIRHNAIFLKVRSLVRDMLNGLLSIKRIKRPIGFWLSTVAIWVLYFFMSYIVFFAFEPTEQLGVEAGLLVLIMGGIGMSAPVQGGIGSFHLFVSGILFLYGISEKDGAFFAFVLHTSQIISVLVIGGLSFIVSVFIPKRDAKNVNS